MKRIVSLMACAVLFASVSAANAGLFNRICAPACAPACEAPACEAAEEAAPACEAACDATCAP